MRNLFDETRLNGMSLINRFVRSATWEGMCDAEGRPTPRLAGCYRNLARGRVALLITGYAFVRPDGKGMAGMMGAHTDDFAPDMRRLVEEVHREGGKICMQLAHCGGQTTSQAAGGQPAAPSALKLEQYPETPRELSEQEAGDIVRCFGEAAGRARRWGFDAVQIHAAHGFLVNEFLSPLCNRRTDRYGGTPENRMRFLLEAYRSIRQRVGDDFPVLVKLNGRDNLQGGLEIEDAVAAARALDEEGIDAIEVSSGTPASGEETPVRQKIDHREQEAYNLPFAARIRSVVSCPVMVVGGLRSFETVEGIVRRVEAEYISLSRPLIREPRLIARWQQGDEERARCISCNGCFRPGVEERGIYCVVDRIEQENRQRPI